MMTRALVLLLSSALLQIVRAEDTFEAFRAKFHPEPYSSQAEQAFRAAVFSANMKRAVLMSEDAAEYGMTQFSDLTHDEFNQPLRGAHTIQRVRRIVCSCACRCASRACGLGG